MPTTTAKLSILVTPAVKRRLEAEARAKQTTVGDLVRRRIAGEPDGEERSLVEALRDLARRATAVAAEVDAVHAEIERDRATQAERESSIREAAVKALSNDDHAALSALFARTQSTAGEARP